MVADLEAAVSNFPRGAGHIVGRVLPSHGLEDLVVQALDAHLDPRHPRIEEEREDLTAAPVRSGLHRQPHDPVERALVLGLSIRERGGGRPVEAVVNAAEDLLLVRPGAEGNVPPITITSILEVEWPIASSVSTRWWTIARASQWNCAPRRADGSSPV